MHTHHPTLHTLTHLSACLVVADAVASYEEHVGVMPVARCSPLDEHRAVYPPVLYDG